MTMPDMHRTPRRPTPRVLYTHRGQQRLRTMSLKADRAMNILLRPMTDDDYTRAIDALEDVVQCATLMLADLARGDSRYTVSNDPGISEPENT